MMNVCFAGGSTPKDLIQRVQNLERRLLQLESYSPEYTLPQVQVVVFSACVHMHHMNYQVRLATIWSDTCKIHGSVYELYYHT